MRCSRRTKPHGDRTPHPGCGQASWRSLGRRGVAAACGTPQETHLSSWLSRLRLPRLTASTSAGRKEEGGGGEEACAQLPGESRRKRRKKKLPKLSSARAPRTWKPGHHFLRQRRLHVHASALVAFGQPLFMMSQRFSLHHGDVFFLRAPGIWQSPVRRLPRLRYTGKLEFPGDDFRWCFLRAPGI